MGWVNILVSALVAVLAVVVTGIVWRRMSQRRRLAKGRVVDVAVARSTDVPPGSMREVSVAGIGPEGSGVALTTIAAGTRGTGSRKGRGAGGRQRQHKKVLLVRTDTGKLRALGAKCTHNGAPLVKGVLCGDRLTCPWHATCFNACTGDIEDGPTLDALPCYPTREADGKIYVRLPGTSSEIKRVRHAKLTRAVPGDERIFVVVGGGAAGAAAVQALREQGFTGHIRLISSETHLPYNRVALNRHIGDEVQSLVTKLMLRPERFYEEYHVLAYLGAGSEVVAIDTESRTVQTFNGGAIHYDKLLCATGGRARTLASLSVVPDIQQGEGVPGSDLGNVFTLRTAEDASGLGKALAEASAGGRQPSVVVVGSSFVAMETVAYLCMVKGLTNITVVGRQKEPLEHKLGTVVGQHLRRMAADRGVVFHMGAVVTRLDGQPPAPGSTGAAVKLASAGTGAATAAATATGAGTSAGAGSGVGVTSSVRDVVSSVTIRNLHEERVTQIPCDVVVVGVGIDLNTEYLRGAAGVEFDDEGAVLADDYLRATEHVFVAGDIASVPYWRADKRVPSRIRVEHWGMAVQHGRIAAYNMLRPTAPKPVRTVPFFWTTQFKSLRYAGFCAPGAIEETILHGTAEKFVAYLVAGGQVRAVATLNCDPAAAAALELIRLGRMPQADDLRDAGSFDLPKYLAGVAERLAARG